MINVGIDLGTTFSTVSHVNAHGVPALFPDAKDASEFRTPSVVLFAPEGCLVGSVAEDILDEEPHLPVIRFVKLSMGKKKTVFEDQQGRSWSPQAISALILRKLLRDAEAFSGEEAGASVITVPAQFSDAERRATRDAAALAGIGELTLIEEPVAAATYYGASEKETEQTLFVYDLGGGTFDATILHGSPEGLFVLATEGAENLGGKRFDEMIRNAAVGDLPDAKPEALDSDPALNLQLLRYAEQTKIKLSKGRLDHVRQTVLVSSKVLEFMITRRQFESLITPIVEETIAISERCLAGAGLSWASIDKVLLVGGSTLVPLVSETVKRVSGKSDSGIVSRQPHQAVAFGAALLAGQASVDRESLEIPPLIQRIATSDLGIRVQDHETGEPAVQVLIPRNTPLPANHTSTYYTSRADQARMVLEIVQAKGRGSEARSLGYFAFGPIANPEINHPIEVTLAYDEEGLVKVTAKDPSTGQEMEHTIESDVQPEASRLRREREMVMSIPIA